MSLMRWSLADVAEQLGASLSLSSEVLVDRVVMDSRLVQAGDLFVALAGARVDGHAFLCEVAKQGAVAAIVTRYVPDCSLPQIRVPDAVEALQTLARVWRMRHKISPCIAVTGSNGKTSVKELLASVLGSVHQPERVLATRGNLNNHLGLPLTLLSLRDAHKTAVVEVGANHVGEIAQLTPLVQADTVIITSIGFAHVGEFGGLEAVIRAKGEILQGLSADDVAVLPILSADDACDSWQVWQADALRARVVVFGHKDHVMSARGWHSWVGLVARRATDTGQYVSLDSRDWGSAEIFLPILGAHQAMNVAVVSAALLMRGYSWQAIQQGLQQVRLPSGRLSVISLSDRLTVIDDSYNANPSSMLAAIDVLMEQSAPIKVLVVGDMAELGESTRDWHDQLGRSAKASGVNRLLAMGEQAHHVVEGFGDGAVVMADMFSIAQDILSLGYDHDRVCVLVKGSRSSQMERVVEVLKDLLKNA